MTNDYLMNQIETMARALALFVFNKRDEDVIEIVDEDGGFAKDRFLQYTLRKLLLQGDINGAENIQFETVEADADPAYLPVVQDFYERLAEMNEAQLASCQYSRQEIYDGLRDVMRIFNVPQEDEINDSTDV